MEEKKKKTTAKKTTAKKVAAKKTLKEEKTTTKKNVAKKAPVKKTPTKVTKKATKKVTKKAVEKIDIPVIEKEKKQEDLLEKTYIFNKQEKDNLDEVISKLNNEKIYSEDKIIERSPLNKGLIAFLTLVILGVVIFCIVYSVSNSMEENKGEEIPSSYKNIKVQDNTKSDDEDETESFSDIDYSNVINTTINDFEVKVAEGQDMLVLISSQTCYYCITFEPILNEVLVAKKDEAIRLNITRMSEAETKRLRTYYAFTSAPTLLVIKKGIVKAEASGYMNKEEFSKWYDENVK